MSKMKTVFARVRQNVFRKVSCLLAHDSLFYVISHERSGTHFAINSILANSFARHGEGMGRGAGDGWHNIGEWFGPYDDKAVRFVHIDGFNANWANAAVHASIIKSHCDHELYETRYVKAKVIYVLRDPRDTLTSWFHYLHRDEYYRYNREVPDQRCGSFGEFLRNPTSPFLRYSYSLNGNFANVAERWASHVGGWLSAPEVLVIRYEDLRRSHKQVLRQISQYLGLRLKPHSRPIGLHDAPSQLPRKGTIGDWRNIFSEADETLLRRAVEAKGIDWRHVIEPTPQSLPRR